MEAVITNIELRLKYFIAEFIYCTIDELEVLRYEYELATKMTVGKKNSMCKVIDAYITVKRMLSDRGI